MVIDKGSSLAFVAIGGCFRDLGLGFGEWGVAVMTKGVCTSSPLQPPDDIMCRVQATSGCGGDGPEACDAWE